jgi:hypothetical protein
VSFKQFYGFLFGITVLISVNSLCMGSITNGLVAWYPLDGNATDMSTNSNDGTIYGASTTTDRHGFTSRALLFDGSNDYIQAAYSSAISSSNFSYSLWAKPTQTTSSFGSPITFRNNGKGFNLYKKPNNTWSYWIGNGGWLALGSRSITLSWTALAFTYDGTNHKAYENGSHVASTSSSYLLNQSKPLRIGAGATESNSPNYYFNGAIDEVRIYNRSLSATEISALYSTENTVPNSPPTDLNSTSVISFSENLPIGNFIGEFNATDTDQGSTISYHLVSGAGDSNNSLFSLESNGSLKNAVVFDFETNASTYSIRVQAKDEYNATIEGNFTISLLNQVEDLDNDGTEDHFDSDDDGDGFSDSVEIAYGSNPRDSNSVANAAPNTLTLNTSGFQENQPIGTVAGTLTSTDPDNGDTLSIQLVAGSGSTANSLFSLESNGTLKTTVSYDFETNSTSYPIRARVTDQHGAYLENNFTISLLNQVEDLDNDGTEDHFDSDDDGDGFSDSVEIAYGSNPRDPNSVANQAPNSLVLNSSGFQENQPAGTIAGTLTATDPDNGDTLSIQLVAGSGSTANSLFSLESNGTLKTTVSFDFETNSTSYPIRARVTDQHGAYIENNFTISLINQVEDLDNDGTEDHFDSDDDGDGFSDSVEIAYGSNPRDPNSVANAAPNTLVLNSSGFQENQPAGTIAGTLTATDPDNGDTLSIQLVAGSGSTANHLFSLESNGTLKTTVSFDFETNSTSYPIRARVTDQHGAYIENNFTISLLNQVEDLDNDGTEDHFDFGR